MHMQAKAGLTLSAKAGTGSQDGRPMLLPMALQSSPMVTGFGAVALKLPLKLVLVMASTNKATRSSLHGHDIKNGSTASRRRGGSQCGLRTLQAPWCARSAAASYGYLAMR